jgi:hypothetical protein
VKIDRRLLVPLAMLLTVAMGGAVYAFNALSVTTTLSVKEPLSINLAAATGDLALDSMSCTISTDSLSASCSGSAYAGDVGAVQITVANSGREALTVTPTVTSSSNDVTLASPSAASVGAGAISVFNFGVTISASATTPDTVTLTMTFAR